MPKDKAMPHRPVVGDRIKLKAERITAYMEAAKAAGYTFDPYQIREVIRIDKFAPGGGERLFVLGDPHCFLPRDITLAWSTEEERRGMLRTNGWLYNSKRNLWEQP